MISGRGDPANGRHSHHLERSLVALHPVAGLVFPALVAVHPLDKHPVVLLGGHGPILLSTRLRAVAVASRRVPLVRLNSGVSDSAPVGQCQGPLKHHRRILNAGFAPCDAPTTRSHLQQSVECLEGSFEPIQDLVSQIVRQYPDVAAEVASWPVVIETRTIRE